MNRFSFAIACISVTSLPLLDDDGVCAALIMAFMDRLAAEGPAELGGGGGAIPPLLPRWSFAGIEAKLYRSKVLGGPSHFKNFIRPWARQQPLLPMQSVLSFFPRATSLAARPHAPPSFCGGFANAVIAFFP